MKNPIRINVNYFDDTINEIFKYEIKNKFISNSDIYPNNKYMFDYIEQNIFNFVHFIYFLNDALITKDINAGDIKKILNLFKKIIKEKCPSLKFKINVLNDGSYESFFEANKYLGVWVKYEDFIYEPDWRNRSISIDEIHKLLSVFDIDIKQEDIDLFFENNKEVNKKSNLINLKITRAIKWLLESLKTKFLDLEIFNWWDVVQLPFEYFDVIFNYYVSINKIKKYDSKVIYRLLNLIYKKQSIKSIDEFIELVELIFPNNYDDVINWINNKTNTYVYKINERYKIVTPNKFTPILISILEENYVNQYFDINQIKEEFNNIDWNNISISTRTFDNLVHKNILMINTSKVFYFHNYDDFLQNDFPIILEKIQSIPSGWYNSNFICENFGYLLNKYNINDFQLIHKLLKYIFVNELENKYDDIIKFTRQPGILIREENNDDWLKYLFSSRNINVKETVKLLKDEYGWSTDSGALECTITSTYYEYESEVNLTKDLSQDKILELHNFMNEIKICSHDTLKDKFTSLGIDLKYYNKHILCNVLKCSYCTNYICPRENNVEKLVREEVKLLKVFDIQKQFKYLSSFLGSTKIPLLFSMHKNEWNLISYDQNKFINITYFEEDFNKLCNLIYEYIESSSYEYINYEDLFMYINNNFVSDELEYYITKTLLLNIAKRKYKVVSFEKYTFINEQFDSKESFLISLFNDENKLTLANIYDAFLNKFRLSLSFNEISSLIKYIRLNTLYFDPKDKILYKSQQDFELEVNENKW